MNSNNLYKYILSILICFLTYATHLSVQATPTDVRSAAKLRAHVLETAGLQDSFYELSDDELNQDWSLDVKGVESVTRERFSSLSRFEDLQHVTVQLLGFDVPTTSSDADIPPVPLPVDELLKMLDALVADTSFYVMGSDTSKPRRLGVRRRVQYTVEVGTQYLEERILSIIKNQTDPDPSAPISTVRTLRTVPLAGIDAELARDAEERAHGGIVFYVFARRDWQPSMNYAYSMPHTRPSAPRCVTNLFCGTETRYAYLDITAGPVHWGPMHVGEGFVSTQLSLPFVERYVEQLSKHAAADEVSPDHHLFFTRLQDNVAADLAAFIDASARHLVVPPLAHFPIDSRSDLHIILVTVHQGSLAQSRFDRHGFEAALHQMRKLPEQSVRVKHLQIELRKNALLSTAVAMSTKMHPVASPSDGSVLAMHEYLDSRELHRWLARFVSLILTEEAVGLDEFELETEAMPVFLFDFTQDSNMMLLDRTEPAVSFADMVLAVQTPQERLLLDFVCLSGGETTRAEMHLDARDATRSTLAAVLRSVWGVAAPHEWYAPHHEATEYDYLWAMGARAPHGPFSHLFHTNSIEMAFFLRDAPARNLVYTQIEFALTEVQSTMSLFLNYRKELADVLPAAAYRTFVRRWNVFQFKLDETRQLLTALDFERAHYMVRSLQYEVWELDRLVSRAGESVRSSLACTINGPSWIRLVTASPRRRWNFAIGILTLGLSVILVLYMARTGVWERLRATFTLYLSSKSAAKKKKSE